MNISITQDETFIRSLYLHRCFNNISKDENEDESTRREARNETIRFFIEMINRSIQCFYEESIIDAENVFFKYLYWKQIIIENNLTRYTSNFQCTADSSESEQQLLEGLKKLSDRYEKFKTEYLRLSATEKAKVEEYLRAYNILKQEKPVTNKKTFVKHVAARFVDYLETITKKRCLTNFGRNNCDEQVLQGEANYILGKLNENGCINVKEVTQKAWDVFNSFRENDENNRKAEEQGITLSLKKFHQLVNERRLERFKRQLAKAIADIELRLKTGIKHVFRMTGTVFRPILHPIETIKSLKYAVMHPKDSAKALLILVKDNKLKTVFIVLGSVAIGVAIGVGVGGPLLALGLTVDVAVGVLCGFLASSVVASSSALVTVAVKCVPLCQKAGYEKELKRNEYGTQLQSIKDEESVLLKDQKKEEYVRKEALTAAVQAEMYYEIIDQLDHEVQVLRDSQLNNLDDSSLPSTLHDLNSTLLDVEEEQMNMSSSRQATEKQLHEIRADHAAINVGQNACRRVQQRSSSFLASFINNEGLNDM